MGKNRSDLTEAQFFFVLHITIFFSKSNFYSFFSAENKPFWEVVQAVDQKVDMGARFLGLPKNWEDNKLDIIDCYIN